MRVGLSVSLNLHVRVYKDWISGAETDSLFESWGSLKKKIKQSLHGEDKAYHRINTDLFSVGRREKVGFKHKVWSGP